MSGWFHFARDWLPAAPKSRPKGLRQVSAAGALSVSDESFASGPLPAQAAAIARFLQEQGLLRLSDGASPRGHRSPE